MSAKIDPVFTIHDLDLLPDDDNRYELIEGEIIASRSPGVPHQRVLGNLYVIVRTFLDRNPIAEILPHAGK
jgi:Uma2 family endonuclease